MAKMKIKRGDILNKMTVDQAIHQVAADYKDVVFYVGSKTTFLFIGTAEEWDAFGIDENIGQKHYDNFVFNKYRSASEYMQVMDDMTTHVKSAKQPTDKEKAKLDDILDKLSKKKLACEQAWDKMCYYDNAVRTFQPITKRKVRNISVKDPQADTDVVNGLIINIDGYEDGGYWFYHEFRNQKKAYDKNIGGN